MSFVLHRGADDIVVCFAPTGPHPSAKRSSGLDSASIPPHRLLCEADVRFSAWTKSRQMVSFASIYVVDWTKSRRVQRRRTKVICVHPSIRLSVRDAEKWRSGEVEKRKSGEVDWTKSFASIRPRSGKVEKRKSGEVEKRSSGLDKIICNAKAGAKAVRLYRSKG
jgi:hypothetical protein